MLKNLQGKRLFTCLLPVFMLAAFGTAATAQVTHVEDFENFPVTAGQYQDGTFEGQDGSTWEYVKARGDVHINAPTPGLRNESDAKIESGIISGGLSELSFDYMQMFTNNVELEVFVNDNLVATVTSDSQQNEVLNSGTIVIEDVEDDFTLRFQNTSGAQVAIDNVTWTSVTDTGDNGDEEVGTFTVYYNNPDNWDDVYIYAWNDASGEAYQIWPGVAMTEPAVDNEWYSYELPDTLDMIVFNENVDGGAQTDDLSRNKTGWYDGNEWFIQVANIGEVWEDDDQGEIYHITGEVIVTYINRANRNQHFIADATGAIVIDDNSQVLGDNHFSIGDGMTDLRAALSIFSNTYQLVPQDNPGISSADNELPYETVTLDELTAADQSKLVFVENVEFDATGDFSSGQNYTLTDAVDNDITFRTAFSGADYIGDPIVQGPINLYAIVGQFQGNPQLTARSSDDFIFDIAAFNLLAPADGTTLVLEGDVSTEVTIDWEDAASDVEVSYTWHFDPEGDFSDPALSVSAGQASELTLNYGTIYQALSALGEDLEESDVVAGEWTVTAEAGSKVVLAEQSWDISFEVGELVSEIADFALLSPEDGAELMVDGVADTEVEITWEPGESDIAPTYTWYLNDENDFSGDVIASLPSNNDGQDTVLTVTMADLDALLDDAGVEVGATADLYWTVQASGINSEKFATSAFSISLERGVVGDLIDLLAVSDIADVRPLEDDTLVVIVGIVNSPDFGFGVADYFVQDLTGGINITDFDQGGARDGTVVAPGDSIRILGSLGTHEQQRNLGVEDFRILSSENALPEPVEITGEDVTLDSEYQGMRVKMMDMYIIDEDLDNWPTDPIDDGSGVNLRITSEVEADTFIVRLARNNTPWGDDEGNVGQPLPEMPFNLTGVMGRFRSDAQIFPFFLEDFEVVPEPLPIPEPPHAIGDIINYNGGFEYSDLGNVEAGVDAWTFNNVAGNSVLEIVDDETHDGERALRIDFGEWNESADDWNVEAVNEPFYVEEGDELEISVWIKADSDERVANLYLGLPASGNWVRYPSHPGVAVDLYDEWTEYTYRHTANADDAEHGMRYSIAMNFEENDGAMIYIDHVQVEIVEATSAGDMADLPMEFALRQNYPNPFNPTTTISYEMPETAHVTIDVYNVLGQHMMSLVNTEQTRGVHSVSFDASNFSSGMYIYRMQSGNFVQTQKMMLVK